MRAARTERPPILIIIAILGCPSAIRGVLAGCLDYYIRYLRSFKFKLHRLGLWALEQGWGLGEAHWPGQFLQNAACSTGIAGQVLSRYQACAASIADSRAESIKASAVAAASSAASMDAAGYSAYAAVAAAGWARAPSMGASAGSEEASSAAEAAAQALPAEEPFLASACEPGGSAA